MMYYGNGMGTGWLLMVFAVALPALLLTAGLIAIQMRRAPAERPAAGSDPLHDAEQVLAARFARGEIETEEYELRLHVLRSAHR